MLQTIQHIYLIGLGAMGGLYASRLYDYNPNIIKIILDKERQDRYQKNGVFINGKKYAFQYVQSTQANALPKADLIIVGVKANQLETSIVAIQPFIKKETRIISILNGISSEVFLGNTLGMQHLLYAYGVEMDAFRKDTNISFTQFGKIVFGEKNNEQISPDVALIQQVFKHAHIPYETPIDMNKALWKKFMLNVAANQVSAALKFNYGQLRNNYAAQNLMFDAAKEVLLLSQKIGIGLTEEDWRSVLKPMEALDANNYTSMAQDILAKRKTELGIFGETVVNLGIQYGINTPTNKVLVQLIHALEGSY